MADVPVRDAATVLLVRDGLRGLEVFMLQRNLRSAFVAGAYLFPGGALDPADAHADLEARCAGRTDAEASALLGLDAGGLAFWVAAIRECFEEAGVLLAYGPDGEIMRLGRADIADRFAAHRDAMNAGTLGLVDMCRAEGLQLAVDAMFAFGHWVTPPGLPRRYDTRFFVAATPPVQTPLHDDLEAIAHAWIRPSDALARNEAGELQLISPTKLSLKAIARFEKADELLAAAAGPPRWIETGGGARIALPGDA